MSKKVTKIVLESNQASDYYGENMLDPEGSSKYTG